MKRTWMSDEVSSAETDRQRVELLPARTIMSAFGCIGDIDNVIGTMLGAEGNGTGGVGGGAAGGDGFYSGDGGTGGAGGRGQGGYSGF